MVEENRKSLRDQKIVDTWSEQDLHEKETIEQGDVSKDINPSVYGESQPKYPSPECLSSLEQK